MSEPNAKVTCEYSISGVCFSLGDHRLGSYSLRDLENVDFNNELSIKLGVEPKEVLTAQLDAIERPTTFPEIGRIMSLTVKEDDESKQITFAGCLNAQTDQDQFNISFQAESSTGKTYVPLEVVAYFPQKEVVLIASASPTSFFHESGQWDEEKKCYVVDLEKKILVFLDQPHFMLLERLQDRQANSTIISRKTR